MPTKTTAISNKKHSWLYNVYHGFMKSFWQVFSYFMCLLFSLLFMQFDIILGLYIFFIMAFILTSYYFIWGLLFFIFNKKK